MWEHHVYGDHPERRAERRVETARSAVGNVRRGRRRRDGERYGWQFDGHRGQRVRFAGTAAEHHPLPGAASAQLRRRRGPADDELVRGAKRGLVLERR